LCLLIEAMISGRFKVQVECDSLLFAMYLYTATLFVFSIACPLKC